MMLCLLLFYTGIVDCENVRCQVYHWVIFYLNSFILLVFFYPLTLVVVAFFPSLPHKLMTRMRLLCVRFMCLPKEEREMNMISVSSLYFFSCSCAFFFFFISFHEFCDCVRHSYYFFFYLWLVIRLCRSVSPTNKCFNCKSLFFSR